MSLLQRAIALILTLYALVYALPLALLAGYRSGTLSADALRAAPVDAASLLALGPAEAGVWTAAVLAYLLAAFALSKRSEHAVWVYALAIGLDLANWQAGPHGGAYSAAFAEAGIKTDYLILGANFVFLAAAMLMARGWGRPARSL